MYRCFFNSLQPHQWNCSSKGIRLLPCHILPPSKRPEALLLQWGVAPGLLLPPQAEARGRGYVCFVVLDRSEALLAGAEVQIGASGGRMEARDKCYFLRVCCLRACSRCRAPGVLDPAPIENEGAADPKGPTPTKPWVGVEDAPKERLVPDVPTPGVGVF